MPRYMGTNHTNPAIPSSILPIWLFLPVMRANCPSQQSNMSAHSSSTTPIRLSIRPYSPP